MYESLKFSINVTIAMLLYVSGLLNRHVYACM